MARVPGAPCDRAPGGDERLAGADRDAQLVGSSHAKCQYRGVERSREARQGGSLVNRQYRLFVGVDWAKDEHAVCVLDADQKVWERRTIEQSGAGLGQLGDWLTKLAAPDLDSVAVAIEMPRGAVVEYLVERGFAVYSLNPKQMDRFRDRHTVAGAKDDRRDAFVMADALRTDLPLFHRVQLDNPFIIRIRELSRAEEDIQQEQVRMGHQLRELLNRYYPQMLKLCPGVDEAWFWDLIEIAPVVNPKAETKNRGHNEGEE